ncbi:MAG: nitrous oxide reductase accessory protein NosL [Bacteroidetes bacterium]|nr:nitrous oxide reductase accessory protein NosL [Bacteroidota bacterium]
MKRRLSAGTKLILLIAAAGLVAVLFMPIWRIDLNAPQYPEGLSLQIHVNGLKGNVDIINGLNHYIGMKTLHNEDFVEFKILPYAVIFFAVLFILAVVVNRRKFLNAVFILFVLFGVVAMYDFWKWEYDYGHNLNPDAAIKVPGMAYQPPLIGFKQLLNFGAYSIPDTGGWCFIGAGALLLIAVIIEWKTGKVKQYIKAPVAAAMLVFVLPFSSCNAGPEAIVPGTDNCYFCKMGISEVKYAAELVTKKGKALKFDDIHCLLSFTGSKMIDKAQVKDIYVTDYSGSQTLIKATEAFFLKGGDIHGPMNGDIIAFGNQDSLKKIALQVKGIEVNWEEIAK